MIEERTDTPETGSLARAASALVAALRERGSTIALAESCTAGLAAAALADTPGASRALWGSFVAYTPEAKAAMLGLGGEQLTESRIVSTELAAAMARAALERSGADLAAAVTGWAGPYAPEREGGPGRIALAWLRRDGAGSALELRLEGDRGKIRGEAARELLAGALSLLTSA